MKVKKALIPAAGFGTRFLPATKSIPKEMIPVVDKPVIQYVVEEAVNAGISDILIVISRGKRAIEEHFDSSMELEYILEKKGKEKELAEIRKISSLANIHFIYQKEMRGLGDAVLHGRHHIGDEPFAVLLGDTIVESNTEKPVLKELIETAEKNKASAIAVQQVPDEKVNRYGIMDGKNISENIYQVNKWVEKPDIKKAPSNLAIASRYVFTSTIFNILEKTKPGLNNEVQLTDAMHELLKKEKMYALKFNGTRYDIGNKLDFIKTNLLFGMRNEQIGKELKNWLNGVIDNC